MFRLVCNCFYICTIVPPYFVYVSLTANGVIQVDETTKQYDTKLSLLGIMGVFRYYTAWIQTKRSSNPHLTPNEARMNFVSVSNMTCSRRMFESWWQTLPLPSQDTPIQADAEASAGAGFIDEEAFAV